MTDEPTCATGIAAHAPLPLAMSAISRATANVLERHMPSLDLADAGAAEEHRAYAALVAAHREAAYNLAAVGNAMAACHDLPTGPHEMAVLASPENAAAFRQFVETEHTLLELLQSRLADDEAMLAAMSG